MEGKNSLGLRLYPRCALCVIGPSRLSQAQVTYGIITVIFVGNHALCMRPLEDVQMTASGCVPCQAFCRVTLCMCPLYQLKLTCSSRRCTSSPCVDGHSILQGAATVNGITQHRQVTVLSCCTGADEGAEAAVVERPLQQLRRAGCDSADGGCMANIVQIAPGQISQPHRRPLCLPQQRPETCGSPC